MKINLVYGEGMFSAGFLNISPFPQRDENFILADLSNLDMFVDDAEAEVIIANDVINFLPKPTVLSTIDHWLRKLRHGGRIVIGGTDLYELARDICKQSVDLKTVNNTLYGNEIMPWDTRRNSFYTESIVDYLQEKGLEILKQRVDKYNMIVEAIRP